MNGFLEEAYRNGCLTPSDMNEHMPTLLRYARLCEHITEFGVRDFVSTYAFLLANPKKLISYDIVKTKLEEKIPIQDNFDYRIEDVLKVDIEETDLLFIDTLHTYNQLKQELALHASKVRKYIIFHDTVTFGDALNPAINEFLEEHKEWVIKEVFTNCNGLTVISKLNY
jgi:hypothetical protein